MAHEITYTHETEQPIKVAFPDEEGCPFIPQSNYSFGARARVEMCSNINHAVHSAYGTLAGAHPSAYPGASNHACGVATALMDSLMTSIGFHRGPIGQN